MTGTGPEAPVSPVSADDHRYFQTIEEAFLRLRGKATLLSAADWQVAQAWHRSGVPVELVVRVMEELFGRTGERAAKRRGRTISSLTYFRAAVDAAWEEIAELSAGSRRERIEPMRIDRRLRRLSESLSERVPDRERWMEAIAGLDGDLAAVESRLAELDREVVMALELAISPAEGAAIEESVARAVAPLRGRLPSEEIENALASLRTRHLRDRFGMPVLSLFAPEALEPGEDATT